MPPTGITVTGESGALAQAVSRRAENHGRIKRIRQAGIGDAALFAALMTVVASRQGQIAKLCADGREPLMHAGGFPFTRPKPHRHRIVAFGVESARRSRSEIAMQELREGLVENGQRWRTGPGDRLGACRRRHHGLRYRFGSVSIGAVPPAIDGPIRVDLARVQPRKRERYLQAVAPLSLANRTA